MKSLQIKNLLSEQGNYFRTKDLIKQGFTNYQIAKLVESNILIKMYQGVYQLSDSEKIKMQDINVIVENGIISFESAVFYYKLADGEEGKITLTLNRDQKPPKMPQKLFNYYYTTSELYNLGVNIIDQDGRKIKIYNQERTICDLLKHRSKFEERFIYEALKNYLQSNSCNIEKLMSYAEKTRTKNTLIQYLAKIGEKNGQIESK